MVWPPIPLSSCGTLRHEVTVTLESIHDQPDLCHW